MKYVSALLFIPCLLILSSPAFSETNTFHDSFESGMGNWSNVGGDDFNWVTRSGSTPSGATGPSGAYDGTYYVYCESSTPNYPSKSADLLFKSSICAPGGEFNFTSGSISFWYHMYGTAMGTLSLELWNGSAWETVWSKSGDQTDSWFFENINLNSYAGEGRKIRFHCVTGTSFTSDMCLDNVSVSLECVFGKPTGFQGTGFSSSGITWAWSDVGDEEGYQIFDNSTGNLIIDNIAGNTSSTVESGLSPNSPYSRFARAFKDGKSTFSDNSSASVAYTLTGAATGLSFTGRTTNTLSMQCDTPPNPESGMTGIFFDCISGGVGGSDSPWSVSTTYTDDSLDPNTTYSYRAVWRNADGAEDTPSSAINWCTLANIPAMANNSTFFPYRTKTSIDVYVNLAGNPDGTELELYYAAGDAAAPTPPFASAGTKTSGYTWILGGLSPETSYWFKACARSWDGAKSDNCALTVWSTASISAPTSFGVAGRSATSIDWTWTDTNSDEEGHQILDCLSQTVVIDEIPANTTFVTESPLLENTLYTRMVRAYKSNKTVFSDYSNFASTYTLVQDPFDSELVLTALSPTSLCGSITAPTNPSAGQTGSSFNAPESCLAWGISSFGEVGDGIDRVRSRPVRTLGITSAVQISTHYEHCLALLANGSVLAWGRNSFGKLGDGTDIDRNKPVCVMWTDNAVKVSTGYNHSIALLDDRTVVGWGYNFYGQVGDGSQSTRYAPVATSGITDAVSTAAGYYHSLALLSNGSVLAWGSNSYGQLGDGTTTNRLTPVLVSGIEDAIGIAAGNHHSLAALSNGSILAWGKNTYGQLGDGTNTQREFPVLVSGISDNASLAAGASHSIAFLSNGSVFAWGYNYYGQLGDGSTINKYTPEPVFGLTDVASIGAGQHHSFAVLSNGSVLGWGKNSENQLGDGTTIQSTIPVAVSYLTDAVSVCGGSFHSIALRSDGSVSAWGWNVDGRLGDGTDIFQATPLSVRETNGVVGIAGGYFHSICSLSNGSVLAWGRNNYGQLGDGTGTDRLTPVPVSGISSAVDVAAGECHSLAILLDNSVQAWGYNFYGQLGDGTTATRLTPVSVSGITNAVGVAAGYFHSLAVLSNKSILAWGQNNQGQLGDGTTSHRYTPVLVTGVTDAIGIAGGSNFSLAVLSNGSVLAWGYNAYGQLGDGTTTRRLTPVLVSGITDAIAVAAGNYHSMALLSNGSVLAWGYNGIGQLGDGTLNTRYTPVLVSGVTNAVSIAAGFSFSVASRSDGSVMAWGNNKYRQLGDGSTILYRTTPVQTIGADNVTEVAAGYYHTLAIGSVASGWLTGQYACTFDDLVPNTTYFFKSKLRNTEGIETAWTGVKSVFTPCTKPAGLWFSNISQTEISFYWAAHGNPAWTIYHVDMSLDGAVYNRVLNTTGIEYSNNSLLPVTRYYYRVRAVNIDGIPTGWVYASEITLGPPGEPTDLRTNGRTNPASLGCDSITFNAIYPECNPASAANAAWVVVDNDPSFLNPEWNSTWMTLDPPVGNLARCPGQAYAGSPLSPGVTYYWQIKFRNEAGQESQWSAETAYFVRAAYTVNLENAGWHLLEIPCYTGTQTVQELLGDDLGILWIWYYNEAARKWFQLGANDTFQDGVGYFVWCKYSGEVAGFNGTAITGDMGPVMLSWTNTGSFGNDGWNLVRHPYPNALSWSSHATFQNCETTYWHPWNGDEYLLYDKFTGGCASGTLPAGASLWVHANGSNSQITFLEPPDGAPSPLPPPVLNWKVRFEAKSGAYQDTQSYIGARHGALLNHDQYDILKIRSYSLEYIRVF
ncbi:MAG: RCC1 domain-containing protein, partial [Planctomycetota bacterium]